MSVVREIRPAARLWPLAAVVLLGLVVTVGSYLLFRPFDAPGGYFPGAPIGRDFVNFWLGGRLANEGRLPILFDEQAYGGLIRSTFLRDHDDRYLFSYPPSILPLLAPFGALPYRLALALWTLLNVACFVQACRLTLDRTAVVVLALLSPAFLMTVIYGHFGGVAALIVAGLVRFGGTRPWACAAGLALLSVKPQLFGALVLISLLAGLWPVVWRACAGAAALALLSLALYGLGPWEGFVRWTLPLHAALLAEFPIRAFRTTISAYAGLRMAGAPAAWADAVQIAVSLVVLVLLAVRLRRTGDPLARGLCFGLGTVAILPYANHYDLAIAAPALAALFRREPFVAAPLWLAPALAPVPGILSIPLAPLTFLLPTLAFLAQEAASAWRQDGGSHEDVRGPHVAGGAPAEAGR